MLSIFRGHKGVFILLALFLALVSPGDRAESRTNTSKEYEAIQKDIKSKEAQLEQASKVEHITLNDLHNINRQLDAVSAELKKYRTRLARTKAAVGRVTAEIEELEGKVRKRKSLMMRKLRAMHRYGTYSDALLVLGASEDLPQLMRMWRYMESLAVFEKETIRGLRKDLASLNAREAELRKLQGRLMSEEKEVSLREVSLNQKKKRKEEMLAIIRREKATFERLLRELRKAAAGMDKIVRDSAVDSRYAGKGFRGLKGRLPWPVPGSVAVPYGTQMDPVFHTPVFRNGIYIESGNDIVAKSVHSGKVVFANWFKGYGQLVIINHGEGYHTLYANLSEIFLRTGDIIGKEDRIGRVGTSGLVDRPSLYFEIRYKGKPLDPSQWLIRR